MKTQFSFRAFLHTRLGIFLWTLLVATLAYHFGQHYNPAEGVKAARPRIVT